MDNINFLPMRHRMALRKKGVALLTAGAFFFSFSASPFLDASSVKRSFPQQTKTVLNGPSSLLRDSFCPLVGRRGWTVEGRLLPFITQLEDNHGDAPSQLAAVPLLDKVNSQRGNEPLLIGAEGAWETLDLAPLAALPAGEWRNRWLNRLLWRGDLTGEEYWILSRSPDRVSLVGIDDPILHKQNEDVRAIVETTRHETESFLLDLAKRVGRLKTALFPPSWLALDHMFSQFDDGSISINQLSVRLLDVAPAHWMEENTPRLFCLAQVGDAPVDPEDVRTELQKLLSLSLTPDESNRLYSGSPMKDADIHFNNIFAVAEARNIPLPLTKRYARQMRLSRDIEPMALSKEVDLARKALFSQIPSSGLSATNLLMLNEALTSLRGLVALTLTPDDWAQFQSEPRWRDAKQLVDSIVDLENRQKMRTTSSYLPPSFSYVLQNAESFYSIAKQRDRAMATNLIRNARERGAAHCVVVAGGFHTPGMADLFRQWGAPFEVLCPIPEHTSPTLRQTDAFQQAETRQRVLFATARELSTQKPGQLQEWMHSLSSKDQRALRKAGFGPPLIFLSFRNSFKKLMGRWAMAMAEFLRDQWEFYQSLHAYRDTTAWAVLTTPIPPFKYLIPPSIHHTPAEHSPALPQRELGLTETEMFQSLIEATQDPQNPAFPSPINESPWQKAENYLWKLWAGHRSARLVGQAFMDFRLNGKTTTEARALVVNHLSPHALGLLGQGLMDYYQDRDLERLYDRRKLNQTLLKNLNAGEGFFADVKATLSQIHQSLLDEVNEIRGIDSKGTPGRTLMDPMDPDTNAVLTDVKENEEATALFAEEIKTLLDRWNAGADRDLIQQTKWMVVKIKQHFQPTIKGILLPTAESLFDPSGQTRAKLPAYREWIRNTESEPTQKRELALRAWRSAEFLSRSVVKGNLLDPLAHTPTPSAYGQIAGNKDALEKTLASLRTPENPIVAISLPYDEAKTAVLRDLATALAASPLSSSGPRRLLRVRLSRLGRDPGSRATALNNMVERAGELGGTALAIDLDEVAPLMENVPKPMERLLHSWAGLKSPPPLVFISSSRSHQEFLNTGSRDKSPVVAFPPGRESVRALLTSEAQRIQTASSCEIQTEAVDRLADAVFSSGTVDFAEALKSLRWAAADALIKSAEEGRQPIVRSKDIVLNEDIPLRELPLARQARIVLGRVDEKFAQSLNNLLASFESLNPNSPFYSSMEARLRHAIGLWHMFPKDENASREVRLTQEEIDSGVAKAWTFFNSHLMGLERQKRAVIETYIQHDLEQRGNHPHAPSNNLCLVGPHGTGKTELAALLAKHTKRKLVKIDAGGASSDEQIKGTISTFVGSQPSKIDLALEEEGTDELVVLIDEIDKASPKFWNALIQLLEKDQPLESRYHTFKPPKRRIITITTANDWDSIPEALKSRLKRTDFNEFSPTELKKTAALFTWSKVATDFPSSRVRCDDPYKIISLLVDDYLEHPALRELERMITRVHRAANLVAIEAGPRFLPVVVDEAFVKELFGTPIQRPQHMVRGDTPGQIMGLGVLGNGIGVPLPVQVIALPMDQVPGAPLLVTGSAGETMQASGLNAVTALRGRWERHPSDFAQSLPLAKLRLHIHLPPLKNDKDGPSAGAAMAVGAYSEITQRQVNPSVAITGALLPSGQITPVGGISEKIQAARIQGKTLIFIPSGNENDLNAYLEGQNPGAQPVAIVSQGETTYFFKGTMDLQNIKPMRVVPGGVYIRQTDLVNLPPEKQPRITIVLARGIDDIIDYPDAILPPGTIVSPPEGNPPLEVPPSIPAGSTIKEEKSTTKGGTAPAPTIHKEKGDYIPPNIYNRSVSTTLTLSTGETITPQNFLQLVDEKEQMSILKTVLTSGSADGLALFEALTRALWVINPTRAGTIFKSLFDNLSTQSLLFPPSPNEEDGLGAPFLGHMVAAQVNGAVQAALSLNSMSNRMLNCQMTLDEISGEIEISDIESGIENLSFIREELQTALGQIEFLPPGKEYDAPENRAVRLYWENRRDLLLLLANQLDELISMIGSQESGQAPSNQTLKEAYLALFRSAFQFKQAEQRHIEEHQTAPVNGLIQHPLLKMVGDSALRDMVIQLVDQMTRRTRRRDQDLGGEASRLADIQLNLVRLNEPITNNYLKDHSRTSPTRPHSTPVTAESAKWATPAASAAAETVSRLGDRVLTIVCPSEQRRKELPDLIAAQLRDSKDLPLFSKSYRLLSLDFSKNHSPNPGRDFERMESLITHVRESESAILYIDLTSLKAWAGGDYFVVMKRLLRTASEDSPHPPLTVIFGSDQETHTQTDNTIASYGAATRTLRLPTPTAEEIVAVLNNRARQMAEKALPITFAESLWQNALADGRLATDLDECIAVFNLTVGTVLQQKRDKPVDQEFLDNIIKLRLKQEKNMDSIIKRAEKEVPKIPNPSARRRGEEFLARLKTLSPNDIETVIVSNYLEWLLKWDWNPPSPPKPTEADIARLTKRAGDIMNKRLYGQHKLKRRILEMYSTYLWQLHNGQNPKLPIIGLTGPYGSGKTTVAGIIADVFNIVFKKFDMSSESDPRRIRGFEHYVVGAEPGIPYQLTTEAVQQAKTEREDPAKKPDEIHEPGKAVILVDEFEKAEPSHLGDPRNAMHPYLDPEQRKKVEEDFFGVSFDYENTMFILTMNKPEAILPSLRDRMEEIDVPLLEDEEQVGLASDMLLDRIATEKGIVLTDGLSPASVAPALSARVLDFGTPKEKAALFQDLIDGWVSGGARELGRAVEMLLTSALYENSAIAAKANYATVAPLRVRKEDLPRLLGSRRQGNPREMALSPTATAGEALFYGESSQPGGASVWSAETPGEPARLQWPRGEMDEIRASPREKQSVERMKEMLAILWTVAHKRFPAHLFGNRFMVEFLGAPGGQSKDEALAAYVALASRAFHRAIGKDTAFFGEIEATGKIRDVGRDIERRLQRARSHGVFQFHLNARRDEVFGLMNKHPRLAGLILHGNQVTLCIPNRQTPTPEEWEDTPGATVSRRPIKTPLPGLLDNSVWSKETPERLRKSAGEKKINFDESEENGMCKINFKTLKDALNVLTNAGLEEKDVPRFFLSSSVDDVLGHLNFPPDLPRTGGLGQGGFHLAAILGLTFIVGLLGFAFIGDATAGLSLAGLAGANPMGELPSLAKGVGALALSLGILSLQLSNFPSPLKAEVKPTLSALLSFSEGLSENERTTLQNIILKEGSREVAITSLTDDEIEAIHQTARTVTPQVPVPSLSLWFNARKDILQACATELKRRGKPTRRSQEAESILYPELIPPSEANVLDHSKEFKRITQTNSQV